MEQEAQSNMWSEDLLNRKAEAEHLTTYLQNLYRDKQGQSATNTFVLNINAEWGFGKTFFLEKWREQLIEQGYLVAGFDAWATDFSNEPLLSFISEVSDYLSGASDRSPETKEAFNTFKKTFFSIAKGLAPLAAEVIVKKATGFGLDELGEEINSSGADEEVEGGEENLATAMSKLAKIATSAALSDYSGKKEGIKKFKQSLTALIEGFVSQGIQLPIFIFVDELDRCRPSYAIELLESIKHLFGIEGLYFVVATDSEQLCHAIRSVYGESFDSQKYIKRFFDLDYQFPLPDNRDYASYLFRQTNIDEAFFVPNEMIDGHLSSVFSDLSQYFKLTLRDQKQVFELIKACALSHGNDHKLHLIPLMLLACIKHIDKKSTYRKFCTQINSKTLSGLLDRLRSENALNETITYKTYRRSDGDFCNLILGEVLSFYAKIFNKPLNNLFDYRVVNNGIEEDILNGMRDHTTSNLNYVDRLIPNKFSSYPEIINQGGRFASIG